MATKTLTVIYVGPFAEGVVIDNGQSFLPGEPIDVDEAIAGRPPSGTPGEDDYDPGEGLLAQTGNFVEAHMASATVDKVLEQVGDDPERAAAALALEQARGEKARSTLIDKLEAIVAAGKGDESNG